MEIKQKINRKMSNCHRIIIYEIHNQSLLEPSKEESKEVEFYGTFLTSTEN